MELQLNEKLLFNVLLVLSNTPNHVMLSFNTNQFKFVLFVSFNALVSLSITHKLMSNNMVLHFSMLPHSFNKLVLLVLLKTFHLQLVEQPLVSVLAHMVKNQHHSVLHHQASKVVLLLVLVVVLVHHNHHLNHQVVVLV